MSIIFDHNVENLIMLKRKIEKEFGPFDCSRIDKVYLYFYQTLKADYLFFQLPIVTALTRLEQQLEDQKIAYHLEKFHKFIEKERLMKLDKHFFISCTYFGEGGKASFWRFEPNRILFNIPIVITPQNKLSFSFNEQSFLEQIFYQTIALQFTTKREKFAPLMERHKIAESELIRAFFGALHYGIYAFDVHKEEFQLVKVTDGLHRKRRELKVAETHFELAMQITPVLNAFYEDRKGLDEEFMTEFAKVLAVRPPDNLIDKKTKKELEKEGVIFEMLQS